MAATPMPMPMTRRSMLGASAAALASATNRKTVAAIVTEYRYRSHADVICGRILEGYSPDNVRVEPRTRIVSMYTDQIAEKDMSRDLAAKHAFRIYPTIAEALTLGSDRLAVDAVLLIGEHGNYPVNEKGQKLYPRFDLYQRIVEVFRSTKRTVPVFSDKHLSYSWDKANSMYRQARELRFPLMAGSSIPVTVRVPELELPLGCRIRRAVAVGYGDLDAYGFHTLETLQCMVERRAGGETGIESVEWIEGADVWQWRDGPGAWSAPLLAAALSRGANQDGAVEQNAKRPVLFLLRYRDGFEAAVYMLNGHARGWMFATELDGKIVSTHFGSSKLRDLAHFDGLVHAIEHLFVTGKPLYPVERTLLTTGALAFLFEARVLRKRLATSELRFAYQAPRKCYFQHA
ncbi:MAG: hypothetical protein ACRD8O_13360 [Bryobacteraceae bacterium]